MNAPAVTRTGIEAIVLTREELMYPAVRRIAALLAQELHEMRVANDNAESIQDTTLRRGEIRLAKRILARLEVGPESRQSESFVWPESAPADDYVGPLSGE